MRDGTSPCRLSRRGVLRGTAAAAVTALLAACGGGASAPTVPPPTMAAPTPAPVTAPPPTAAPATFTPAPPRPTAGVPTSTPQTLQSGIKVDVDSYKLFIRATGTGSPTVILEAGAGSGSEDWSKVEPEVAKFTRVVAYDRANRGQSDHGPDPNTCQQMVADLHTLLRSQQIAGPLVLVGESFGGMVNEVYAKAYATDIAGLVFVDAAHEDLYLNPETKLASDIMRGVDYRQSALQVKAALPLPDVPLIVLSHGQRTGLLTAAQEERWPAWQEELVARTSKSKQVIAEKSGHNIQFDQPDLVIAAVKEIVSGAWK